LLGLLLPELSLQLGFHDVHDGLADGALLVADGLNKNTVPNQRPVLLKALFRPMYIS
jgi:hypothetical protein